METEFVKNGYLVKIEQDTDVYSPSEDQDEHAFIVTTRNRYFQVDGPNGETADTIGENLKEWETTHHVYKLNALIHSGIRLSITSDLKEHYMGWDSGQIGFLLVTRDRSEILNPYKYAKGMVEIWNQYLNGDVWGYTIEDGEENTIDSCWGFYGFEECKAEAKASVPDDPPEYPYNEDYPVSDWRYEVQNGDTKLGYADWLLHKQEADEV
jgi:hypothetical protein